MKIHILQKFIEGPWGGGNQFLKALRDNWASKGFYEEDPANADVILFNSFPFREEYRFRQVYKLKLAGKVIVHRIDGPIGLYREGDYYVDKIINRFNKYFVDGTIYQSEWSRQKNYQNGFVRNVYEKVILNAPDPLIFNRIGRIDFDFNRKIRIIATSWSNNIKKGFKLYKYLDDNLDFSRFEMTFVGNTPLQFKNIKHVNPLSSLELAKKLKDHDMFITASESDPCSNSLIEALHCGLPAVVLNDGGHPEIIKKAGEVFSSSDDVIEKIEQVVGNYHYYQNNIDLPNIDLVAEMYFKFCEEVHDKVASQNTRPRKFILDKLWMILLEIGLYKFINLIKNVYKRFFVA